MHHRYIFVSGSHCGSHHGVSDPLLNPLDALFSQRNFMMEQHPWTPKSIAQMALRHHYFHVRVVDCVLGLVRRLHLSRHRLVEQHYQGVLRRGRLHAAYASGAFAADVRRHSSRQC
jgi:hypothetical protein